MRRTTLSRPGLTIACLLGGLLAIAGCSPSFGGRSAPEREVIIIPAGSTVVCADGRPLPCR